MSANTETAVSVTETQCKLTPPNLLNRRHISQCLSEDIAAAENVSVL